MYIYVAYTYFINIQSNPKRGGGSNSTLLSTPEIKPVNSFSLIYSSSTWYVICWSDVNLALLFNVLDIVGGGVPPCLIREFTLTLGQLVRDLNRNGYVYAPLYAECMFWHVKLR